MKNDKLSKDKMPTNVVLVFAVVGIFVISLIILAASIMYAISPWPLLAFALILIVALSLKIIDDWINDDPYRYYD